jgi:hypothetical protein
VRSVLFLLVVVLLLLLLLWWYWFYGERSWGDEYSFTCCLPNELMQ